MRDTQYRHVSSCRMRLATSRLDCKSGTVFRLIIISENYVLFDYKRFLRCFVNSGKPGQTRSIDFLTLLHAMFLTAAVM